MRHKHIRYVNRNNQKSIFLIKPLRQVNNDVDINKYLSKSSLPRNKRKSAKYNNNVSRSKIGAQPSSTPTPALFSANYETV